MSRTDERREQLRAAFSAELDDHIRSLNQLLLRLEHEDTDESRKGTLDALFREAHSLKGAARTMGFVPAGELAHALETSLEAVRTGQTQPAGTWFDAAYRAVDLFEPLCRAILAGEEPPVELAEAIGQLSPDKDGLAHPSRAPDPISARPLETAGEGAPPRQPAATTRPPPPARLSSATGPAQRVPARPEPESMRVAVDKLDALFSKAGELAVSQIRIEQHAQEILDLHQEFNRWGRDWRTLRGFRAQLRRQLGAGGPLDGAASGHLTALLRSTEMAESQYEALEGRLGEIASWLRRDCAQLGLATHAIGDDVMGVRLLTAGTIFGPFERLVRDLTRSTDKLAQLILQGSEIEIDRDILERLKDPLMHLVRNAIDHGIERPEERQASGKPPIGTVRLSVAQQGSTIQIEVSDDGPGLDPARVREVAVAKGLLAPEQAADLDDHAALDLIFLPGLTTRQEVTETSGRGVGLDVVRSVVEALRGSVDVRTAAGQETCFTLHVPLSLATTRVLLVEVGVQVFALPSASVERTGRLKPAQVINLEGRAAISVEGHPVPLVELAHVLDRPARPRDPEQWQPFLILSQADRQLALLVDRLVDEQEIVVKALGWPLRRVPNVAGVTVLGTGQTAVVLNPGDIFRSVLELLSGRAPDGTAEPAAGPPRTMARLLVVDDSLTTRTLERSILEAAGYNVCVAADGREALQVLRDEPVDLVVSDVDMPGLDGFALTEEIRKDQRLRHIPVVLVTGLEAEEHRQRGVAAGADAYLVKQGFDQNHLIATIERLL